jgi:hypothetical protein
LLADPGHAHWVQLHWGEDQYLDRENVFYRMLLIDGLATQARIYGNTPHLDLLRSQVESLAAELANSATCLLADFPAQTFPADVAAAWHAILRADVVLGTSHRQRVAEGLRGFTGVMAPGGGLPPYAWFDDPPRHTPVRGSANAWLLHHAPLLWPEQAASWAGTFNRQFWQASRWRVGYREFARNERHPHSGDIDSGPIIAGLGVAASAFGIGATRIQADAAKARPLALQAIALSWPLPNGRLLLPMVLSDIGHAPMLGEAALLYNLSLAPSPSPAGGNGGPGPVPWLVWTILAAQLFLGLSALVFAVRLFRPGSGSDARGSAD